jgi:hypothetical protein
MASAEAGGDKGAWIDAIVPTLKASFPMIRGLVWFDVNKETRLARQFLGRIAGRVHPDAERPVLQPVSPLTAPRWAAQAGGCRVSDTPTDRRA